MVAAKKARNAVVNGTNHTDASLAAMKTTEVAGLVAAIRGDGKAPKPATKAKAIELFWQAAERLPATPEAPKAPEVQDANRPTLGGGRSSTAVERGVPKILAYRPEVMGRATVTPRSAPALLESAKYFVRLGFRSITFKPAMNCGWTTADYNVFRSQYQRLAEFYFDSLLARKPLRIDDFSVMMKTIHSKSVSSIGCGAGTGLILVDPRGDLWPCHRYGPHQCGGQFRFARIGEAFNDRLRDVFLRQHMVNDIKNNCDACLARLTCVG